MAGPLTARQQQILDYIRAHQQRQGVSPSLREIQAHFRLASPFGIKRHLDALIAKGALQRLPGKARGLLTPAVARVSPLVPVPLYGSIPAGRPTLEEQEPEAFVSVDPTALGVAPRTPLYALRVRGDSMTGASILDGDIVFITPREPRPREIVAALIDGESTLKRFLVERGRPFLRAENPRYPDLIPAAELVIQGVMAGLLRPSPPG